ncbi:S41 family peptidase [Chitinophagaceae bacterium LWZ2-11]
MKATYRLVFIFFALQSCISASIHNYSFNQKTAAPQLQEDVILLKKILEANHPSLYWYTPKDSIDFYFDNLIASIHDSLSETAFRNKVTYAVSKIRCGHTSVRFSKNYNAVLENHRYPQFPLYLKAWQDSLVVLLSVTPKDSIFKRGTIVTSINGRKPKALLDSMRQLINTDGYSENYKYQLFSGNFPYWYKLVWGLDTTYNIKYIDSTGIEQNALVKNFIPAKDTTKKKDTTGSIARVQPSPAKPSRKQRRNAALSAKRSMQIDTTTQTAFIKLTTFNDGRLRTFFRKSFRTIKEKNIKNVVIDVRENGGGKLNSSTLLTKYLIDKPFKTGDTVAAISRRFKYGKYIPEAIVFWWPMNFCTHKEADGRYHNRRSENHYYQPKTTNHFNGNIYLLQGGFSFSATTMFISNIKGQKNVTVIGEETGGGYYGNSAMNLPTIILPNSKLRVVLPMYRLVIDSTRIKNGRGVIPDIEVLPSSNAIKAGIDLKLTKVKELIEEKK